MLRRRYVALLIVAGFCVAGVYAQQQLTLMATIVDPEKNAAPDTLTPADIRVTEDDVAAKVVKVDSVLRAVKVQLLIDNGVGMGGNLSQLRNGVRSLIEALPKDIEATLVTTAPQPRFVVKPTKNREELLKGVDRLTPDNGAGRFTESLLEAAERANKEKDTFTVIISAGTTSGDGDVREDTTKQLFQQINGKPILVDVLMYQGETSGTGGGSQIEVGQAVTRNTGGRYEYINSMSRYATLMPEFGPDVAKQVAGSAKQFRISVQRPEGKSGKLGRLSISAGARTVASVRLE
jgi:hypothetical protein